MPIKVVVFVGHRHYGSMRIAYLGHPASPNAWYRAIGPAEALARRGHEIRCVMPHPGQFIEAAIRGADVLLVHRFCDESTMAAVRYARSAGIGVVWDNDDDLSAIPRGDRSHHQARGLGGWRVQKAIRTIVTTADAVTTPSALLAEHYRELGAGDVRLIENHVTDESARSGLRRPDGGGVIVGWIAGTEHRADVERLPLRDAFGRLLDAHPDVRVETIGATLGLRHPRYRHRERVLFIELPETAASFDVGIAPIADIPFNRARSNVKLKEYAVVGVPWLASPIGPYRDMGERQGGRLVRDHEWFEQLSCLIEKPRDLRKLAKRAAKWGRGQTVSANVRQWEDVLRQAAERAGIPPSLAAQPAR